MDISKTSSTKAPASLPSGPDRGAFRASYSDWKLIRTRKVVQIVLEVPVEEADAAYQVLGGMPNPAESFWCAVARLQPDQAAKPAKKKQEWHELKPSAQISIRCGETAFRAFLAETFPLAWTGWG